MEQEKQERRRPTEDNQEYQGASPCEHCGSDTCEGVVKAALWGERGWLVIEDIPARVCQGCGEQFYDEETTGKMAKVIAAPAAGAKQKILVPIFSLTEVEVPKEESRPEVLDEEEMEAVETTFTGTEGTGHEMEEDRESREASLCKYCESHTHEDTVKSAFWAAGGLVAVEDIPAQVCEGCGEQFYADETARKIAELATHGFPAEKANRKTLVPVFSLAEAEVPNRKGHPSSNHRTTTGREAIGRITLGATTVAAAAGARPRENSSGSSGPAS